MKRCYLIDLIELSYLTLEVREVEQNYYKIIVLAIGLIIQCVKPTPVWFLSIKQITLI